METDHEYMDISLGVPSTLDADIYFYTANFVNGEPGLVASSVNAAEGDDEGLHFIPEQRVD